jgi:Mn-containing catalase
MPQVKELLVEELQDLLHAESQLVDALPKMAQAAHNPKLKEAFEKHLRQTQQHVERIKEAFGMLNERAQPKPCRAMAGLIEEGTEKIQEGQDKEPNAADLSLITAAQKVEHYEIAAYGTVRTLARQLGMLDVETLVNHTLGEEESTDFLLTSIAKPILQQASIDDSGGSVNLDSTPASELEHASSGSGRQLKTKKSVK